MVNIALIGVGYWGQKLQGYIEQSDKFTLKYACNSKSNLDDVWSDPYVDAVVIATPNETHYSLAKMALLNEKHVLVEKPPAMTSQKCIELAQLALDKNLALMTDYNYTFSESLQKAKSIISWIGQVIALDITIKRIDRFPNRDAYWVLGSHAMSILHIFAPLYLLEFRRLDMIRENGRIRSGALAFGDKGIAGRILVDLKGRRKTEVLIYGKKGMITYNPSAKVPLTVAGDVYATFKYNERHNLRHMLEHFYKVVKGDAVGNLDMALTISRVLEELGCQK